MQGVRFYQVNQKNSYIYADSHKYLWIAIE